MPHAVVAGAGYVGGVAARLLREAGWDVTAIVRSPESRSELTGVEALAFDVSDAPAVQSHSATLATADALIYCVSSGRGGADAYRAAYVEGLQNLLAIAPQARVIFTSSTSVYAQTDGSEVDETSAAEPDRETGQILRQAEKMALARGGCVARLAGIYGPGRSVYLQKFLEGRAVIEGDGSRWINQIHRDDAARALVQLATTPSAQGLYNVADDHPDTLLGVYTLLSQHFARPLPPHGSIDLHRKRGWTSKRVRNPRLHALGWTPHFPAYADALREFGETLLTDD